MAHRHWFPRKAPHLVVVLCFALLSWPAASVLAQEPQQGPDIQALLQKAQAEGTVRIIAGLALPGGFYPEGRLPGRQAVESQRADIATVRAQVLESLKGQPARAYRVYNSIPFVALQVDAGSLETLASDPRVLSIQEDVLSKAMLASSTVAIGAPAAWAGGYDGSGQTVVILDTGIDADHPFFGGRVVTEACFSDANGTSDGVSLCPNGLATQYGSGAADATATQCWNGGESTQLCAHGSHVAGIAAGSDYAGGPGYNGVAPGADIIAIQVFTRFDQLADCGGVPPCVGSWSSDQIAALEYAYDTLRGSYPLASINMSLGSGSYTSQALCDGANVAFKAAVDNLRASGIVTAIASGNDGWTDAIASPGCVSSAVGVGSSTDYDDVSSFSNMHSMVDLMAPGSSIDSSIPDNTYANYQGTSMATPHVAGAWAVLKQGDPSATVDQVLAALQNTGVPVDDQRAGGLYTKPRIQLDAALLALLPENVWQGGAGNWSVAGNWSQNEVPGCMSRATIPAGTSPTVDADSQVGTLTIEAGGQLNMSAHTLGVCGNWHVQSPGRFEGTGGTVVFKGMAAQTIDMAAGSAGQFYDLQVGDGSSHQTVAAQSDLEVNGDFAIRPGALFEAGGHVLSVAGNWDDQGPGFRASTGQAVLNGGSQFVTKATTGTVLSQYFSEYDTMPNGTFTSAPPSGWFTYQGGNGIAGYETWWFGQYSAHNSEGGFSLRWKSGTASLIDAWLFSPGIYLDSNNSYQLQFKYRIFDSHDDQDLNVKLGGHPASAEMTQAILAYPDLTNTTFAQVAQPFSVASSGTYYLGINNYDSDVGNYYGLEVDNVVLTTVEDLSFYDLDVFSTGSGAAMDGDVQVRHDLAIHSGATMDVGPHKIVTLGGALTNGGTLANEETRALLAGSQTFLDALGRDAALVTVAGGTPPGDTTVYTRIGSTVPALAFGSTCPAAPDGIQRYYNVAAQNESGLDVTLRLYYDDAELNGNDEGSLSIWHCENGGWVQETGTASRDTTANWVQVTGVSSFSPFMLRAEQPTAVEISGFDAVPDGAAIRLEWTTASEMGIQSFNLYRAEAVDGPQTLLDGTPLPENPGLPEGATYSYRDESIQPGLPYYYWLEVLDTYGQSTWLGPKIASGAYRVYLPLLNR